MFHKSFLRESSLPANEGAKRPFMTLLDEMRANYVDTWDRTDMRFGDGNLIAFSSGYGDGVYANYAGFDAEGEVTIILTDCSVVPLSEDSKSGS
jgi:Protein of unknown function (DUF4241)